MKAVKVKSIVRMIFVAGALAVLGGCSGNYPRGQFTGYVIDRTEAEIVSKVGEPAKVDRTKPERPVLIFKSKTFDPDNFNAADPVTRVFLEPNKDGKLVAVEVIFG